METGVNPRRTRTVPEVAQILGIGASTLYKICTYGEVRTIKLGGRILIPLEEIDRILSLR